MLRLVIFATRLWTRIYTWGMSPAFRAARLAEIESDLWESQHDGGRWHPAPALHIFGRLVFGVHDDLTWRIEHCSVQELHGGVAMAARMGGAALFAIAVSVIATDAARPHSRFVFSKPVATDGRRPLLTAGIAAALDTSRGGEQDDPPRADQGAAAAAATFEVASVTPNTSGSPLLRMVPESGGRFTAVNVSLGMLIGHAYQLARFERSGGPDWIESDRFDVLAKAEGDVPQEEIRRMLRALLADRFALRVYREMRPLPVYALVMSRTDGRLGPQLRRTRADCSKAPEAGPGVPFVQGLPPACGYFGGGPAMKNFVFRGMTVSGIATLLKQMVRRVVVDRTGLAGFFDGEFDFTAELGPPPPPPGVADPFDRQAFPTVFTVLPEQLGLKLDSQTGPVEMLVIDSAARPTPD